MKLRNGFVSNSSSSSFMVSGQKGKRPLVVVEIELPVDDEISTKEKLDDYFKENYCDRGQSLQEMLASEEYYREKYEAALAEINKGNVIYMGSVSSEGDMEEQLLYDRGIGEKLQNGTVIYDCN